LGCHLRRCTHSLSPLRPRLQLHPDPPHRHADRHSKRHALPTPHHHPPSTLFHQTTDGSFTLVTTPAATDDQIIALIYQLRDAAHTRTFDKLGIPQSKVDARDPIVSFHIYRGRKCAAEKYADGKLPCGDHYNASGDYTFGGGANHQWDDGAILHPTATGDHQTELWNTNTPYAASSTN
jgi:hypothetical protein